jgi:hypothetical protein
MIAATMAAVLVMWMAFDGARSILEDKRHIGRASAGYLAIAIVGCLTYCIVFGVLTALGLRDQ